MSSSGSGPGFCSDGKAQIGLGLPILDRRRIETTHACTTRLSPDKDNYSLLAVVVVVVGVGVLAAAAGGDSDDGADW